MWLGTALTVYLQGDLGLRGLCYVGGQAGKGRIEVLVLCARQQRQRTGSTVLAP